MSDLFSQAKRAASPARAGLVFHTLKLRNIFCYVEEEVSFARGVSVFAGANGSGKSSLLEALFFALFASGARPVTGRELGEVLRQGARSGAVELDFSFGRHRYRLHTALRRLKDRVQADGERCTLERDDGQRWVKVGEVTGRLQELLHMDSEDFANCVYVRQGEVDRILRANAVERQRMIDRLLHLDRLDDYDRRLKEGALRALRRRLDRLEGGLGTVRSELEALEAQDLAAERGRLERALAEVEARQGALEARRQELAARLLELDRRREAFQTQARQLEALQDQLRALTEELERRGEEERRLRGEIRELEAERAERRRALRAREGELAAGDLSPETELKALTQELAELESRLQAEREAHAETRAERRALEGRRAERQRRREEARTAREAARDRLATLDAQLTSLTAELGLASEPATLEPAPLRAELETAWSERRRALEALQERRAGARAELGRVDREFARARALVEEGRCPTCGQATDAARLGPQLERLKAELDARREEVERLERELEAATAALRDLEARKAALEKLERVLTAWREARGRLTELEEALQALDVQLEEDRQGSEKLREREEAIQARGLELKARREALAARREALEAFQAARRELDHLGQRLEDRQQLFRQLRRAADAQRQERARLEAQIDQLQSALGTLDPAALEAERARLAREHETAQEAWHALQGERDRLHRAQGDLEQKLRRLESKRQEARAAQERLARLQTLAGELERLQALYAEVKLAQRQRNLQALNVVFNHFFELMYFGPSYSGVRLGEDFQIEVIRKDGTPLSPAVLSGGERALINLALRAALHRVLSEAGGVALPLLFDEPTVFLDAQHVGQLERLLEDLGRQVGQVIVVSHETALVEAADHEYRVEKDADNVGHVRRVR